MSFNAESEKVLRDNQLFDRFRSLDDLANKYRKFVDSLAQHGYEDYVVEFDNEMSVRYFVERVLNSKSLSSYKEFDVFRHEVDETDNRLRKLFVVGQDRFDVEKWWVKGILKNGYGNYAADIKLMYGFAIETDF